jgi:hypothetical protein
VGGGGVRPGQPADGSRHLTDDELLKQRLAAVAPEGNPLTTTGFRRRRSSGLLFQIRRRIRRREPTAP